MELSTFLSTLTADESIAYEMVRTAVAASPLELLARRAPDTVFNKKENEIFETELRRPFVPTRAPAAQVAVIIKATRLCNLRCTYCVSWAEGVNQTMTFPVLLRTIREFVLLSGAKSVSFVWHGGEFTMLKPKFFRKMLWLQEFFRPNGLSVTNVMQTNGAALSPEWIKFLKTYQLKVGISLDGPPELNDRRRVDVNGEATSLRVEQTIRNLRAASIPFGVLAVVDRGVLDIGAARFIEYLASLGVPRIAFTVRYETQAGMYQKEHPQLSPEPGFISFHEFVSFLGDVFDRWSEKYAGSLVVREFEKLISAVQTRSAPMSCYWQGRCMEKNFVVEPDGTIGPCDKYAGDPNRFYGNLMRSKLGDIISSSDFIETVTSESVEACEHMRGCKWYSVCRGGCPHDRLTTSLVGGAGEEPCCGLSPLLEKISCSHGVRAVTN